MQFPAAKNMDYIVGIDIHNLVAVLPFLTPVPPPGAPIPHPFYGPIFVWLTPKFPEMNVFINNQPAVAVGGTSYSAHIPFGIPADLLNTSWWRRAFLNIPKVLMLTAMTIIVNMAIALTTMAIAPKSKVAQGFIKDVTGVDVSSVESGLKGIAGSVTKFSQWQSWVQLLMSALPYPLANGAPGIANPTVLVNGAPLATGAPLTTLTCQDMPFALFPNAVTLATSNVMVGLSLKQILMGMAGHAAKGAIQMGVGKVYSSAKNNPLDKFDPEVQFQNQQKQRQQNEADSTAIEAKKSQAKPQNQSNKGCPI